MNYVGADCIRDNRGYVGADCIRDNRGYVGADCIRDNRGYVGADCIRDNRGYNPLLRPTIPLPHKLVRRGHFALQCAIFAHSPCAQFGQTLRKKIIWHAPGR